jgi:hypothetical protein
MFEVTKGELDQLTELVRNEMGGANPFKAHLMSMWAWARAGTKQPTEL